MRALLTLAFCALLACSADAITAQGQARALEERWANCSKVANGRLGALHPDNSMTTPYEMTGTVVAGHDTVDTYSITLRPCSTWVNDENPGYFFRAESTYTTWSFDTPVLNSGKIMDFVMPTTRGAVPKFVGTYDGERQDYDASYPARVTATVICVKDGDITNYVRSFNWTVSKDEKGAKRYLATAEFISNEACARFPYSNKPVPPGGVAALIIVIMCFVIQFSICGWYHKTQAVDENPFTTADMGDAGEYTNIE